MIVLYILSVQKYLITQILLGKMFKHFGSEFHEKNIYCSKTQSVQLSSKVSSVFPSEEHLILGQVKEIDYC